MFSIVKVPRDQTQPVLSRLGGKMRDPGNEVGLHKRTTAKSSLQSLVGVLVFVSKCVRQRRVFVARMFRFLRPVKLNHHHINLNSEFR